MHSQPVPESSGEFQGGWEQSNSPCPKCESKDYHFVRLWESGDGGHEDEKHECRNQTCKYVWWVDGPDG